MSTVRKRFVSSLGKKYVMAVSGGVLFLFVVAHLVGNLQFFLPPEAINHYANLLQTNPEMLWPARIVLMAMAGVHVWSGASLWVENRAARPDRYTVSKPFGASLASQTMLLSGGIAAAFLVFHLLHYTVVVQAISGATVPLAALTDPRTGHHDVYAMMVAGFSVWYVALFYLVGVGLLTFHLSHGASAMFQSLGWRSHTYGLFLDKTAKAIALVLFLGYVSIPVSVQFGRGKDYLKHVIEATAAQSPGKEVAK